MVGGANYAHSQYISFLLDVFFLRELTLRIQYFSRFCCPASFEK